MDEHTVLEVPLDGAGEHQALDVTTDQLELLNALSASSAVEILPHKILSFFFALFRPVEDPADDDEDHRRYND